MASLEVQNQRQERQLARHLSDVSPELASSLRKQRSEQRRVSPEGVTFFACTEGGSSSRGSGDGGNDDAGSAGGGLVLPSFAAYPPAVRAAVVGQLGNAYLQQQAEEVRAGPLAAYCCCLPEFLSFQSFSFPPIRLLLFLPVFLHPSFLLSLPLPRPPGRRDQRCPGLHAAAGADDAGRRQLRRPRVRGWAGGHEGRSRMLAAAGASVPVCRRALSPTPPPQVLAGRVGRARPRRAAAGGHRGHDAAPGGGGRHQGTLLPPAGAQRHPAGGVAPPGLVRV